MDFTFSNREVKAMEDEESCRGMTRRELLQLCGMGMAGMTMAGMPELSYGEEQRDHQTEIEGGK
jgi:hypothetical protein